MANGIADASDALRDKDLGEMVTSVSKIARDNPLLFLGGAMLLGFAASRYAKATSEHSDETSGSGEDVKTSGYSAGANEQGYRDSYPASGL